MSDSSDSVKTAGSRKEEFVSMRPARKVRISTTPGNVHGTIKIKVPEFSPEDPELWFALLEGQFEYHNVTEDSLMYRKVIENLGIQYSKTVKDIIAKPPATDRYLKIKNTLIKRLSASHEEKVKRLLTQEELGDRKPSEFLRHLQDLAGPSVPEKFIQFIWSNRLPQDIQTVLASQPMHSLEQLADLADRIQELTTPRLVAAASSNKICVTQPSEEIAELKKMVQQLTLKLDEHMRGPCCATYSNGRGRPRERERHINSYSTRQRSRSSYQKFPMCWYHAKFGAKAQRCIKPCNFKSENHMGTR